MTVVLDDIFLFIVPGDLLHPFSSLYKADRYSASTLLTNTPGKNPIVFLMAVDDGGGDYTNGIRIAAPMRSAARGLRVNLNQSAYDFRADTVVQYAVVVCLRMHFTVHVRFRSRYKRRRH